jgi:undecaprenyl diphosphate synthase
MHVAIIMDGNGRWAARRHLPRTAGHRAGVKIVDEIVTAAAARRIDILTLYAFSAANWSRPTVEVSSLFTLLRRYLLTQTHRCLEQSIRIEVIGRRDRFSTGLRELIESSERATAHCSRMRLRIAIDYSAQHSLLETCRRLQAQPQTCIDRAAFIEQLAAVDHATTPAPDVDLLIRTGGEKRLSDFLLWECAYAELYFVDTLWPDFNTQAFEQALADYASRERRFGGIPAAAASRSSHG